MAAGTRQKLHNIEHLDIRIDDCQKKKKKRNVKSQKKKENLLGIILDENLNSTSHVDYFCDAIFSPRISVLKQLAALVPVSAIHYSRLKKWPFYSFGVCVASWEI